MARLREEDSVDTLVESTAKGKLLFRLRPLIVVLLFVFMGSGVALLLIGVSRINDEGSAGTVMSVLGAVFIVLAIAIAGIALIPVKYKPWLYEKLNSELYLNTFGAEASTEAQELPQTFLSDRKIELFSIVKAEKFLTLETDLGKAFIAKVESSPTEGDETPHSAVVELVDSGLKKSEKNQGSSNIFKGSMLCLLTKDVELPEFDIQQSNGVKPCDYEGVSEVESPLEGFKIRLQKDLVIDDIRAVIPALRRLASAQRGGITLVSRRRGLAIEVSGMEAGGEYISLDSPKPGAVYTTLEKTLKPLGDVFKAYVKVVQNIAKTRTDDSDRKEEAQ